MKAVSIADASPCSPEATALLERLRSELSALYPDEVGPTPFDVKRMMSSDGAFVIAKIAGEAIGCGGVCRLEPAVAEVKRMFVAKGMRGQGIGRSILDALELKAHQLGFTTLRLETGLKQPEAIALYESSGFHRVDCYGQYQENAMSVCFEKKI
jgi:GNAT superfamily N-acetyltransferase